LTAEGGKTDSGMTRKWGDAATSALLESIIAFIFGLAASVVFNVFVPLGRLAASIYDLDYFLTEYWDLCAAIFGATLFTLSIGLWKAPRAAVSIHAAVMAITLGISGLMRLEMGLPSLVLLQFLLYFTGVLIACELAVVAFARAAWRVIKVFRGI
jgi:hypothetical protein